MMSRNPKHLVVSTAERPDLAPVVASWLWGEFWRARGSSLEETLAVVRTSVTAQRMPRTFVLLVDGKPLGTASLAAQDLETRPDLTPWLAGVFVEPAARGQGLVAHLIGAVEEECRADVDPDAMALYEERRERLSARRLANCRDIRARRRNPMR